MVETNDFDPGVWKGHDFTAARKTYDTSAGRSYSSARSRGVDPSSLVPSSLSTNSSAPLVIVSDVTGSMGQWPAVMFSKLPYLEIEGKEYLGEDLEICWAAIGDAYSDSYPLQIRSFTKGVALKDELLKLVVEGGGGGQVSETYELAALYFARNVAMPNAILKPIIIFIGDEKPYQSIPADLANKWSQVTTKKALSTAEVFEELKRKFSVYLIHKTYDQGSRGVNAFDSTTQEVRSAWVGLLGADQVIDLPTPDRVVDVIFGILAKETRKIGYFRMELEGRQRPDQVEEVYRSLQTLHKLPSGADEIDDPKAGRKSVLRTDDTGTKSRPLV